ncbi:hypothetical protein C172_18486 [Paenibacillus sp. FSL H8-457]|nr:hypothetical protein C172_18486 [Paenibacillus sp. FSL H8-457]
MIWGSLYFAVEHVSGDGKAYNNTDLAFENSRFYAVVRGKRLHSKEYHVNAICNDQAGVKLKLLVLEKGKNGGDA